MRLLDSKMPEFKLQAFKKEKGKDKGEFLEVKSDDLKGKWNILFFYPADFTFVCPTELEDMADHYSELKKMGVEVYSVSTDTHFSHMAWHSSSKAIGKIEFPMLADPTGILTKSLGVYIEEIGLADRATFVINPDGVIKIVELNDGGIGRNASELVRKVKAAQHISKNPEEVCPAKWKGEDDKTLKPGLDLVGKI